MQTLEVCFELPADWDPGDDSVELHREAPRAAQRGRPDGVGMRAVRADGALLLRCETPDGQTFTGELSGWGQSRERNGTGRVYRDGPVVSTVESFGVLEPDEGGAYEAALGFQAWLTVNSADDTIEVALNVHNGMVDHPNAAVTITRLWVETAVENLSAEPDWPEPFFEIEGGDIALLGEQDDANHVFHPRQEREFRFIIDISGDGGGVGWAVVESGPWSWQDADAWWPQDLPVPSLDHFNDSDATKLVAETEDIYDALASGAPWPFKEPAIGFVHGYGAAYGGMTGGSEIHQVDGLYEVSTGVIEGLMGMRAKHRMYTDRQPVALYEADGRPWSPKARHPSWRVFNGGFVKGDPIGFSTQPLRWNETTGKWMEGVADLYTGRWQPIDTQHLARITLTRLALIYLDADPLAKRKLNLLATLAALDIEWEGFASGPQGKGAFIGRAAGWAMQAVAGASSAGEITEFARKWGRMSATVLTHIQMPNGGWEAKNSGKLANKLPGFAVVQAIEHGILMTGAYAMARSYQWHEWPDGATDRTRLLTGVSRGGWHIGSYLWGGSNTRKYMAVGTKDRSTIYATAGEVPDAGVPQGVYDGFQTIPALVYCMLAEAELGLPGASDVSSHGWWGRLEEHYGVLAGGVAKAIEGKYGTNFENLSVILAYAQRHGK